VYGLGPLERWLHDDDVSEVLVNAGTEVWVERQLGPPGPQYVGRLAPGAIDAIIEHILHPVGRRLDRSSPVVDARLADGSRVCAVLPPVSLDGPCLAVRKFGRHQVALDRFAAPAVQALLRDIVRLRCNTVVSGATSSGKTTLLNALAAAVEPNERIITLEDTAELRLRSSHVLRLETRPATADGLSAIAMTELLRTALRLRPDRLVVGEIRGDEATELMQAMNTGHDGSLATVHANGPLDALARIESLVVRTNGGWPMWAVRDQVQRCIDVVVHVQRSSSGQRRVAQIAEVRAATHRDDLDGASRVRLLASGDAVVGSLQRGRR
jgi:pilus assembly protein CpaF